MFFRKKKAARDAALSDAPAVTTPFRRIVTGHDDAGWSILRSIDTLRPVTAGNGEAALAHVWATPEVPANLNDDSDGARMPEDEGGSMIRVVDFLPGRKSRLHRSWSIDYAIVFDGEIELQLDSGEVQHLDAGDIVVQRGTNHLWRNPGEEPCRVVFVLIEAIPVAVNGQLLREA
jgi:quercetin dioxygenase-like cupin family protein